MTGCSESSGIIVECYECGNEFNTKDGMDIEVIVWNKDELDNEYSIDVCPDCNMWTIISKWADEKLRGY